MPVPIAAGIAADACAGSGRASPGIRRIILNNRAQAAQMVDPLRSDMPEFALVGTQRLGGLGPLAEELLASAEQDGACLLIFALGLARTKPSGGGC